MQLRLKMFSMKPYIKLQSLKIFPLEYYRPGDDSGCASKHIWMLTHSSSKKNSCHQIRLHRNLMNVTSNYSVNILKSKHFIFFFYKSALWHSPRLKTSGHIWYTGKHKLIPFCNENFLIPVWNSPKRICFASGTFLVLEALYNNRPRRGCW